MVRMMILCSTSRSQSCQRFLNTGQGTETRVDYIQKESMWPGAVGGTAWVYTFASGTSSMFWAWETSALCAIHPQVQGIQNVGFGLSFSEEEKHILRKVKKSRAS